jgi:hypothetical protein
MALIGELRTMGFRSRGMVGEYGELIAAAVYGEARRAPPSAPGYDLDVDGVGRVQVKTLRSTPTNKRTSMGAMRDPYDVLFALRLDADYVPTGAWEIPRSAVEAVYSHGERTSLTTKLINQPGVREIPAEDLRSATDSITQGQIESAEVVSGDGRGQARDEVPATVLIRRDTQHKRSEFNREEAAAIRSALSALRRADRDAQRKIRGQLRGIGFHRAPGSDLLLLRDVFSDATNAGRKKPFDIRSVMRAVVDRDHAPLERWAGMHEAEIAVTWDAHLGGWPVAVIGIESRPLPRHGPIPADGPEQWTSGTLFPRSSKKIARAINAAAGRRPLVVLANLAGFDGSPESMREWQLEFGAEIGRAIVNYDGPIVFCVVSRYHGGAFVVFSQRLNENLETVALEGAHASVIGGAPAAAVVFARDVEEAARRDERIASHDERIEHAGGPERQRLRAERAAKWTDVLAEKRGEFAAQFDAVHSVERAVRMGSVTRIVAPASLRAYLIEAVERGMRRTVDRPAAADGRTGLAQPLPR